MSSISPPEEKPTNAPSANIPLPQNQPETQGGPTLGISALICTRNRGSSIALAVRSVLEHTAGEMELLVVDQSTNRETEEALASYRSDPRLRYIPTDSVGLSNARNIAIQEARYPICTFTDDDCEAVPGWASAHARIFRDNPNVAVSYGNVIVAPFDATAGFTQGYTIEHDFIGTTMRDKLKARGIGANMALRREMALNIGGFDTELGVGARLKSCEDGDFAVRCLLAGHAVAEASGSAIIHHGFRTWDQGRRVTREAFMGIGAAYIKPLKCGRLSALTLLTYEFFACALWPSLAATLTFQKPTHWGRVISFLRGIALGIGTPVDAKKILYLPKK